MLSAEEIEAMSIDDIKAHFSDIMDTIVTTYGDDEDETAEQPEGESNAK